MSLVVIQARVEAGNLRVEGDVVWRMGSRSLTVRDIRHALSTATNAVPIGSRWDVTGGVDPDGSPLGAAVRIDLGDYVDVVDLIWEEP